MKELLVCYNKDIRTNSSAFKLELYNKSEKITSPICCICYGSYYFELIPSDHIRGFGGEMSKKTIEELRDFLTETLKLMNEEENNDTEHKENL